MSTEKQSPHGPMQPDQFFDFYSHQGAKEMLWKWFSATVSGGFSELSAIEKENIIALYERLNTLLEALHAAEAAKSKDNG
ncbi:MAG: hypothetical protein WKF68_04880 [Daejeonella sp.]